MKLNFLIILLLSVYASFSQSHSYLNHIHNRELNKEINFSDKEIHTGLQPLDISHINLQLDLDSLPGSSPYSRNKKQNWFVRKLLKEHFFIVDEPGFKLASSFLYKFEKGKDDFYQGDLSFNTRGVFVEGLIGNKTYFFSSFFENQTFYTGYIYNFVRKYSVTPGFGRVKGFDTGGFDYSSASGFVSFQALPTLNFQIGNGKHFVGEGYRSLLLSDNAFFYPFFKISFTKNKIQYNNIYSTFQEVSSYDNLQRVHSRKSATFNYFNYIFSKHFQLGLFEGIIWKSTDSLHSNNFNPNMLNPVIGTRALQYGMDGENNLIFGFQTKITPQKNTVLYFQYMLDKAGKSNADKRFGYQTGIKLFEIFGIKNLYCQAEFNKVRPYTYSSSREHLHYTYFNQALAHPLGANFKELIGIFSYSVKDIFVEIKINRIETGLEQDSLFYGNNIFFNYSKPIPEDSQISFLQGDKTKINHVFLKLGYIINRKTNMQVYFGISKRDFIGNQATTNSKYLFFGLRTGLFNEYYDF
ncbi:MAG: hypothetical protein JXR58_09165 [Bacteroidales bacterium]|nr:hypothetical protein [Bacteroidales bacterium]